MIVKYFVVISFIFFNLTCYCQKILVDSSSVALEEEYDDIVPKKVSQGRVFGHDLKSYYKGLGHFFSRPVHWKGKDWRNAGLVTGGTLLAMALDQPIKSYMEKNQTAFLDVLEHGGDLMGRPVPGFIFSGTMYGLGHISKNNWMRETAIITLTSISTAGLIQTISKGSVGRARPEIGGGNFRFDPFNELPGFHSFPSGHTIVAASTTLAIAKNFKNKFVKGGIISLGVLTAWSRVYTEAHWFSDVFLSYALSYFTVETVSKFRRSFNERHPNMKFSARFIPTFNGAALLVMF